MCLRYLAAQVELVERWCVGKVDEVVGFAHVGMLKHNLGFQFF